MIIAELIHQVIERMRGDKNVYRIASHLAYLGHNLGPGDMNVIRDVLGEAHPDLRDDANPVYEPHVRQRSRTSKGATRIPKYKKETQL